MSSARASRAPRRSPGGFVAWLAGVEAGCSGVAGAARPWARNRIVLSGVASTNVLARRIVDEYLAEELPLPRAVFLAWEQTAGRGRHGRSWFSPPGGGAWVSMIHPVPSYEELGALPLLVPLGLCEALDRHLPAARPCRVKWPNDLVVDGRKIGGVLIDAVAPRAEEGTAGAAVIGFGVNLLQQDDELARLAEAGRSGLPATSLIVETSAPIAAPELVWELIEGVAARLAAPADPDTVVAAYRERSAHRLGDELRCRVGEETVEGRFRGFDGRGFLRLEVSLPGAGRETGEELLIRAGELMR